MHEHVLKQRIRIALWIFIAGLVAGGATAIPLEPELRWLGRMVAPDGNPDSCLARWVLRVRDAVIDTNAQYPFLAYGTDWLAFGHFVIAVMFLGPIRDPVRNIWVIQSGLIACALVLPYAVVMGAVRGIPWGWRLIDCLFGILGAVPLWLAYRWTRQLAEDAPANDQR